MRNNINRKTCLLILMTFMTITFFAFSEAFADQRVSGRYLKASGKNIVVELNISDTPPPLVIIVQKLPKGTEVIESIPRVKKYSPAKGVAKWLLRNVQPGKMLITLNLKNPIADGVLKGEVRYRDNSGNMVTSLLAM